MTFFKLSFFKANGTVYLFNVFCPDPKDDKLLLSSRLINVARGIAVLGALWYIATRVWRQIASAEPIDFHPLLWPLALGLWPISISI